MKSSPRLLQLQEALAQKRRPNIAINQSINKSLKKKKKIEVQLIYNVVLVSDVQQSDSVIHIVLDSFPL